MWHLEKHAKNMYQRKNMRTALHLQTRFVGSRLIPGMAWYGCQSDVLDETQLSKDSCFVVPNPSGVLHERESNSRVHTGGSSKAGAAYKSCLISSQNEVRLSSSGKVRQREKLLQ